MNSPQTAEHLFHRDPNFGAAIHRESEEDARLRPDPGQILPLPVGKRTAVRGRSADGPGSAPPNPIARSLQAVADHPGLALGISFAIGILAGGVLLRAERSNFEALGK